jgi:hypothetical protein
MKEYNVKSLNQTPNQVTEEDTPRKDKGFSIFKYMSELFGLSSAEK